MKLTELELGDLVAITSKLNEAHALTELIYFAAGADIALVDSAGDPAGRLVLDDNYAAFVFVPACAQ